MKALAIVLGVVIIVLLCVLFFVKPARGPTAVEIQPPTESSSSAASPDGHLIVVSPRSYQKISSPIVVQGTVTGGGWFFEGSFPVELLDNTGNIIATASAKAEGDWTSTGTIPFAATLSYTGVCDGNLTIVLAKDNPSGLSKNNEELSIPVIDPVPAPCE